MAFTKYTGALMAASYGTLSSVLGLQEIVITQKAKPLAKMKDTTTAPASAYELTADPLGGQGSSSCKVTMKMLLSKSDYGDTPTGVLALTLGGSAALAVVPTVAGDHFDLAGARLQRRVVHPKVREYVPVDVTFESPSSAGAWATT